MGSIVYNMRNLQRLSLTGLQTIAVERKYGRLVSAAHDDVVIYYAARVTHNGGEYRAFAKVGGIRPHPALSTHLLVEVSDYTPFPVAVPAFGPGRDYERSLFGHNWRSMAARGDRALSDDEAAAIIEAACRGWENTMHGGFVGEDRQGFAEQDQAAYQEPPRERENFDRLRRWFANRRECRRRYDCRCSFTGSDLQDREGNPEGECCHIYQLRDGGPDIIQNMIFLCKRMHWAHDRYLITLNDDFSFLHSRFLDSRSRDMLHADGYARVPEDPALRPSLEFIHRHREEFLRLEG